MSLETEREKYAAVLRMWPSYGSANHGAPVLDLIARSTTGPVIDVGCGDNVFVAGLRVRGVVADGIDLVHPAADFIGSADAIPVADGRYDVVTAFDLLEHLEDVDAALREWRRVSRRFVVSIAHIPHVYDGHTLHLTVQPREWWHAKLSTYSDDVTIIQVDRRYPATYYGGTWR